MFGRLLSTRDLSVSRALGCLGGHDLSYSTTHLRRDGRVSLWDRRARALLRSRVREKWAREFAKKGQRGSWQGGESVSGPAVMGPKER